MHMTICCFRSWLAYTNKSLQISSLGAYCFIIFNVLFFMLLVIKDFPPNFQILWSSKKWIQTCNNMISTVRWTCPKAWIQTTDKDNVFRAWQELPCATTCKVTSKWIMVSIIITSPCLSTFYLFDRFFIFLVEKKSFSFIVSLTNLFFLKHRFNKEERGGGLWNKDQAPMLIYVQQFVIGVWIRF